jgi:hypothetical protein
MKTIIKIGLALAVLLACFNVGRALLANYQFEDDVHNGLLFNPRASEQEIVDLVMKTASEHEIEVDPADIDISTRGQDLTVNITYTMPVTVLPGIYSRDITFHPTASTRFLPGASR